MVHGAKEEIVAVFLKELRAKPMDKITVTDIIEKSGISRNTFYYHFADIYNLLQFVLDREVERLSKSILLLNSWPEVLKNLIDYARTYQKEIDHIYYSVPKERIEKFIFSSTQDILYQIVRLEAKGYNVSPEEIQYIADFYRYAIIGFFLRFLWNDMSSDAEKAIDKMAVIFENNIRNLLEDCDRRNREK